MQRTLWNRFATILVWLLAAGSVVYWALQFVSGPALPLSAAVAASSGATSVDPQALAKGLGGGRAAASANPSPNQAESAPPSNMQAARFVLTGVVVQKSGSAQGVALIAVDGKPPRPYRVGSSLADGVVLHSVSAGKAMLSTAPDAPADLTLQLPQLTSAVVGTAIAARPVISPTSPSPMPSPAQATPAANPMSTLGTRPTRPLANRMREAEKEARREGQARDAAPAQ